MRLIMVVFNRCEVHIHAGTDSVNFVVGTKQRRMTGLPTVVTLKKVETLLFYNVNNYVILKY